MCASRSSLVAFPTRRSSDLIRHGMTLGELAKLFNEENRIGAELTIVPMKNWRRDAWFDQTRLPWVNPSPNMRNLHQATRSEEQRLNSSHLVISYAVFCLKKK